MSAIEERVARLEAAVQGQAFELLRTRIELQLYKALIASRRWGSPGGNDRAIEAIDSALADLERADLPADLDPLREELRVALVEYREGLRRLRVTATATNQTRLYRVFDRLADRLIALAAGA